MLKQVVPIVLLRYIAPLLVLGCAGLFVYSMGAQQRPQRKKPPVRKSIPVELVQAKQHNGTLDIVVNGVAIPFRDVQLAPRVSGEVIFKSESLSPGRVVNAGELLFRIDPTDYKIEVARLEQEVAKARLDIERLQLDKENTGRVLAVMQDMASLRRREVQRLEQLRSVNATSASEVDTVELALLSTRQQTTSLENQLRTFDSQSESLKASLELANLRLQSARLDLQRTKISAPFAGVVIANHVEQNGMLTAGTAVATIEDTSKVEVRANLRGEDMEFLQGSGYELPQVPVTVECERAGRNHAWHAVLSRQDGLGIDEKTRTMPVRIVVEHPTQNIGSNQDSVALLRGMFVRVRLHCKPRQPLAVVPESVIRPGKKVWVMRADQLQVESVNIARIADGLAYLDTQRTPLALYQNIISSPVPNAKPGLTVSTIPKKPNRRLESGRAGDGVAARGSRVVMTAAKTAKQP